VAVGSLTGILPQMAEVPYGDGIGVVVVVVGTSLAVSYRFYGRGV
jgi:hypothetical protein